MTHTQVACPVFAFMVQQATAEPGVESNFLRAVESGDIHVCCDLDPVGTPAAKVPKRETRQKLAAPAPFTDQGYGEWASRNLR